MTDVKKAATRKPAAKRGPTKAASLKALGITQEDLDALKELKELRAVVAAEKAASPRQAEKEARRQERIKREETIKEDESASVEQAFYARNLRNMEFRMRLNRQKEKVAPTPLKPRGQRGDLMRLEPGDLQDDHLLTNVELGCIEIITAGEAKRVIEGQVTNAQTAIHPAMAMLRNPKGEEYAEGAVQGADQYVDQSVTVARLNPVGGEYGEIQFSREQRGSFDRDVTQTGAQAPEQGRTLGGNPHLLSDGFAAQRAADAHARRKDIQGVEAGLPAGTKVTLDVPHQVVAPPKPKSK